MKQLKLDDIAEIIANNIIEMKIVSKEQLKNDIRPILKIWLKKCDEPKNNKKTPLTILQKTVIQRKLESDFWKDKVKKLLGNENMNKLYIEQNEMLKNEGF